MTTLVTGARQVGQSGGKVTDGAQSLSTQNEQKQWPHGQRMRMSEARGQSSRQTAHVTLPASSALVAFASSAFFAAPALWSCAMASNLRCVLCECLRRCVWT